MMIISRVRLKSGTLLYCKTGPDSHVCTFLESESLGKRRLLLKSSMQGNLKTQNKTQKHNLHFSYIHIEQHICASIFDICFNEQYFMYMYGTYMLTFYLSSFYQSVHFICTFNTIWTIHEITINLLKEIIYHINIQYQGEALFIVTTLLSKINEKKLPMGKACMITSLHVFINLVKNLHVLFCFSLPYKELKRPIFCCCEALTENVDFQFIYQIIC